MNNSDLKFEIINHLGDISSGSSGWKTELNIVSWNGNAPKYDIRAWNRDHTKMGKGITLSEEDLYRLYDLLKDEVQYLKDSGS